MDPLSADVVARSESPTTKLRWFTVVGFTCHWAPVGSTGRMNIRKLSHMSYVQHVLASDSEIAAAEACRQSESLVVVAVFEGRHFNQTGHDEAARYPLTEPAEKQPAEQSASIHE